MNEQFTQKDIITALLMSFKVTFCDFEEVNGSTVTLYKFRPKIGCKVSKIRSLKDELASALRVSSVRIIAPMEDGCVGIEVPNRKREILYAGDIFNSQEYQQTDMALPIAIGRTVTNDLFMADLTEMPHLLVAGATGQGKSVGLNVMLMSLLQKKSPDEMKLVLIDPKKVELSAYEKIARPYIMRLDGYPSIVTEASHATTILDALCRLMDKRYSILEEARVRNIQEYNATHIDKMQYHVIVIDEYGDLVMDRQYGRSIEYSICRLAQKARAVGMHLIISTQRPSATIVTGNIKANFPTRIAFRTTTGTDSRVVIDQVGAEKLTGKGDMIYFSGASVTRVQCAFIGTEEVDRLCTTIGERYKDCKPKVLRVIQGKEDDFSDFFSRVMCKHGNPFFYGVSNAYCHS